MLQVLIAVKEKTVKGTVAFIIGSLVRHEEDKQNSWREEILKFIYERCSSPDPIESERGSSIFSSLMDGNVGCNLYRIALDYPPGREQ